MQDALRAFTERGSVPTGEKNSQDFADQIKFQVRRVLKHTDASRKQNEKNLTPSMANPNYAKQLAELCAQEEERSKQLHSGNLKFLGMFSQGLGGVLEIHIFA